MKATTLFILILLTTLSLNAQDSCFTRTTSLKINGASIYREGLEASIEKTINRKNTFEMTASTTTWNNKTLQGVYDSTDQVIKNFQQTIESFRMYHLGFQWNHYLIKRKRQLSGLYIGPYLKCYGGTVQYQFVTDQTLLHFGKENNINLESSLFSIAAGGNIGYQINIGNHFLIGGFVQLGYKRGKATPYYENKSYQNEYSTMFTDATINGFDSNFGINLGFIL
ncbi:MAG: hypothetical protein N4A35_10630 [Flavobacteriales bacterium]|jgi:hypothetical protein|nr:hypothetical protein [Flavobacteriales bacterium]